MNNQKERYFDLHATGRKPNTKPYERAAKFKGSGAERKEEVLLFD